LNSCGIRIQGVKVPRLVVLTVVAARRLGRLSLVGLLASAALAWAQDGADPDLAEQLQQLARNAGPGVHRGARVEVELGQLDNRLKLAPCARITPYLPPNARPWGLTRVGLRCTDGGRWNVYMPITVKVFAQSMVATQALPAGTVLSGDHLTSAEVDVASEPSPVIALPGDAIGRPLARTVRPGQAIRQADLRPRQWFAAGDTVRIVAAGRGYSIGAEGLALMAGIDGQSARVRTESGRIVTGRPTGQRRIEVAL
jgi:flagellar basal body P-ring formation protein FlgA